MYQPMLFVHWKQARLLLIPFVVASFGLPLMSVQGLGMSPDGSPVAMDTYQIVMGYQTWLTLFPLLAVALGAVLALTAWNWDHQLNHIYALSLPLERWQYVMLKMGAGVTLILLPASALWLGANLAAVSVALPEGIRAYPNQLALRFFLAVLLSYALFFALASGTIRTTVWIVTAWLTLLIGGSLLVMALGDSSPLGDVNFADEAVRWLVRAGGPFEVFTGNWTLIDV